MQPSSNVGKKIIIVEDNRALADIYKTRLELIGYTVFIGYNGITGLYFIQSEQPDLVLLDIMIPDIAGDQVLRTVRSSDWGQDIPFIVISNLNENEAPAGLRELGIVDYIVKANMSGDTLEKTIESFFAGQPGAATDSAESTTTAQSDSMADGTLEIIEPIPVQAPPQDD